MTLHPRAAEIARSVPDDEYARLLAAPREDLEHGRFAEHAREARAWFAANGSPRWAAASCALLPSEDRDAVLVRDGAGVERFQSRRLARTLERASAHALVVAAVTAGPEIEREATVRWDARPDEAWFLDRLGAAVAEHLVRRVRAGLGGNAADGRVEELLPHLAPGYDGWPLAELAKLMGVLGRACDAFGRRRRGVEVLDSGMLYPRNSMLVAFGVTCSRSRATDTLPCAACSLTTCSFQRTGTE